MPRINLGYGELGNENLTPQRGIPNTQGLNQQADALSRLAQTGAKTYAEIQQNRENVEMAKASVDFAKDIESKEFEFKYQDGDYATQDQRYQEYVQERYQEYEKRLSSPRLFDQFKTNTDKYVFDKGLKIKSNALQNNALEQQAILESTLNDISGLAIRGDQAQFDESVARADGLIQHAFDIGVLDTSEMERSKQKFSNGLSRGKVRQDITLDPKNALQNIRDNKYASLSAEEQSQFEAMAISKIEQSKNRLSSEAKKQANELVSDTILSLKNGYIVQDEELAAARASSKLVGKEEDLEIAVAASEFVTLPKSVREGLPEQLAGVHNAEKRKALEVASEAIERELDKDGYAFAVEQGVIQEVQLDFNDPATVQARLEQIDYLKQHYGRPISPLNNEEADALILALPAMSPRQKTGMALVFGDSEAIWEQLDSKNAGLFSMVGAIGDPVVMEGVFKGQQLLKDKLVLPPEDHATMLSTFDEVVEGVYTGKDRTQMLEATKAYYASLIGPDAEGGFFAKNDFEDALEAVSGGIGKVNGHKIELPRGIKESVFEDYVDNFSAVMVDTFGGAWGFTNEQVAEFVREGRLISVANNQYMVTVNDGMLMNKANDGPFLISYDPEAIQAEAARQQQENLRLDAIVEEELLKERQRQGK